MTFPKPVRFPALVPLVALTALLGSGGVAAQIDFTQEQADSGKATYRESCQICHGSSLMNGQFGTPLRGKSFRDKWTGKSLGELQQFVYEKMPPDNLKSLTPEQVAALVAYIFSRNDLPPTTTPLPADSVSQMAVPLPF